MRKVTTYERHERHVRAWAAGEIDALLILGRPGTGKSHAYRDALAGRAYHLFSARKSPIQVYLELHDAPFLPVVFDDVSALLRDGNFVDMLKNLCETGTRTVRWGTCTRLLEGRSNSFTTNTPVLIVLNRMPEDNPDVMAILDRCDSIEFDPLKQEIIARMREIFPNDGELIDLLAELPVIPSFRTLVKARRWQQSKHLDWRAELVAECGVPEAVNLLLEVMQELPEHEWLDQYIRRTGLTDRTFRRHRHVADQVLASRASQNGCPNVRPGDNGQGRQHPAFRESPPLPLSKLAGPPSNAPPPVAVTESNQHQNEVGKPFRPGRETQSQLAKGGRTVAQHGGNGDLHTTMKCGERKTCPPSEETIQKFQAGTCAKSKEALS